MLEFFEGCRVFLDIRGSIVSGSLKRRSQDFYVSMNKKTCFKISGKDLHIFSNVQ